MLAQCTGRSRIILLVDFKYNEQRTKIGAPVIRALSFYTLYIANGPLILKEIELSFRRLPAVFSSSFHSQVLTMSLQRISSPCNFPKNLEEPRRPRLFPGFSRGLVFAHRNACSRIPAVTTCSGFPICLQLVAFCVVASTRLNIKLYGA